MIRVVLYAVAVFLIVKLPRSAAFNFSCSEAQPIEYITAGDGPDDECILPLRPACDGNFSCIYDALEQGFMLSGNFVNFSEMFLLNHKGRPTFVYINVPLSWNKCNDTRTANVCTASVLFVWGRSPADALFGPVQEVFHFGAFDPLILIGSLILDAVIKIPKYDSHKRDILLPWLSVDYTNISISTDTVCCFSSGIQAENIVLVLRKLLKKSEQLASWNMNDNFHEGGQYAVTYEEVKVLLNIVIALHLFFMTLVAMALIVLQVKFYGAIITKIESFSGMNDTQVAGKNLFVIVLTCGIFLIIHSLSSAGAIAAFYGTHHEAEKKYKAGFGHQMHAGKAMFNFELIVISIALFIIFCCGLIGSIICIANCRASHDVTKKLKKAAILVYIGIGSCIWITIQQVVPLVIHAIIAPWITLALLMQYLCILAVIITIVGVFIFTKIQKDNHSNEQTEGTVLRAQARTMSESDTSVCHDTTDNQDRHMGDVDAEARMHSKWWSCCALSLILVACLGFVTCFTLLMGVGILLGISEVAVTGVIISLVVTVLGGLITGFIKKWCTTEEDQSAVNNNRSSNSEEAANQISVNNYRSINSTEEVSSKSPLLLAAP